MYHPLIILIMKKSIILSAFVAMAFTANAQTTVQGSKFTDNWSVGLRTGIITPVTHSAFFKNARPALGIEFGKQLTPVFGLGIQGMGYINTSNSKTAFDASDISLLGKVNLVNLFSGYAGEPRLFEVEAIAGAGWLHYYTNGNGDTNSWSTRFGANLNFNLGEEKAWTIGITPALVYDMQGDFARAKSRFNLNHAAFELTASLTYHFKGSNGSHHFTLAKLYDPIEISELNGTINNLRQEVNERNNMLNESSRKMGRMQQEINNLRQEASKVVVVKKTNMIPESIVTFRQGKTTVDASQLPNVERVASYMKRHENAVVAIKGYASPEGSVEVNTRIANARAEAVKNILVKKYKISPDRITAEGQGVGDMFTEPDWNRVSICTIEDTNR